MVKRVLVCGAGGFIGSHLVTSLKQQWHRVIGADLKLPEFSTTAADEFVVGDLREPLLVDEILNNVDEVYQLAADMGGAGYVFTGEHDADIMHNSSVINLNICKSAVKHNVKKVFYTSSACIYPGHIQTDPSNAKLVESSAYPAYPDSEYGWEKLFSERVYLAFARNHNLDVRIARLHNVFGPMGTWRGGKEKAPAALCRKVAESSGTVEIWGTGEQTRSFLYIDECIKGIHLLMESECLHPLNLGSSRSISINELATLIASIANKDITIVNIPGPIGVNGRTSDNTMIKEQLGWEPADTLEYGLEQTYKWIQSQI
jgi:GDP-D-mannose 3',5'-epimerase